MTGTSNHEYERPEKGAQDWHEPLNANFSKIDTDVPIVDAEANRGEYDPGVGTLFVATDTGMLYRYDGSAWVQFGVDELGTHPSVTNNEEVDVSDVDPQTGTIIENATDLNFTGGLAALDDDRGDGTATIFSTIDGTNVGNGVGKVFGGRAGRRLTWRTLKNVGTGFQLVKTLAGPAATTVDFRTLKNVGGGLLGGAPVIQRQTATSIDFRSLLHLGGKRVLKGVNGPDIEFRGLTGGNCIAVTSNPNTLRIDYTCVPWIFPPRNGNGNGNGDGDGEENGGIITPSGPDDGPDVTGIKTGSVCADEIKNPDGTLTILGALEVLADALTVINGPLECQGLSTPSASIPDGLSCGPLHSSGDVRCRGIENAARTNETLSIDSASGIEIDGGGGGDGTAACKLKGTGAADHLIEGINTDSGEKVLKLFPNGTLSIGGQLVGSGADYAEWLPRSRSDETIEPGDVVGVRDGELTKNTENACQALVITASPAVVGNTPDEEPEADHETAAFLGQVPTKVRGPVEAGDVIVPSGGNDGVGVAVDPDEWTPADGPIVGRAWESDESRGAGTVTVAVGLDHTDVAGGRIDRVADDLADLREENETLRDRLADLERRMEELEAENAAFRAAVADGRGTDGSAAPNADAEESGVPGDD